MKWKILAICIVSNFWLSGCGLSVPEISPLHADTYDKNGVSSQGNYEKEIFAHIACDLSIGMYQAQKRFKLPWVPEWGTAITLLISAQDQGGVSAGVAFRDPLRNFSQAHAKGGTVTIPQIFSVGLGASVATTVTRAETVQVTWRNIDLITYGHAILRDLREGEQPCKNDGLQIDGELKLSQFIYKKIQLAATGELNPAIIEKPNINTWPLYNALSEELIFLSSFGGNLTPALSLARITANTNSSFFAAQRTYTNDLILTVGSWRDSPAQLSQPA